MNLKRFARLEFGWSAVSIATVVIFWIIFYLINKQIPRVDELKITELWVVKLPRELSCFWLDIPLAPVWPTIFVLFFTWKKINKNLTLATALAVGLIVGQILGRHIGFLSAPFFVGIITGVLISYSREWQYGVAFGLSFGLGAGIWTSLIFGLMLVGTYLPGLFLGWQFGHAYGWMCIKMPFSKSGRFLKKTHEYLVLPILAVDALRAVIVLFGRYPWLAVGLITKKFLHFCLWKRIARTRVWQLARPWLA